MIASAETMLENWNDYLGKEMDVCHEFKHLTSDVISRTAFGSSYLEGRKIFDLLTELTVLISRNTFKIRFWGIEYVCFWLFYISSFFTLCKESSIELVTLLVYLEKK